MTTKDTSTSAYQLPETGFCRIWHIIGNPKANPPIPPVIPIGRTGWWQGVKDGRFPKPTKLSARTTAWRVEDIRALIASHDKAANGEDA